MGIPGASTAFEMNRARKAKRDELKEIEALNDHKVPRVQRMYD